MRVVDFLRRRHVLPALAIGVTILGAEVAVRATNVLSTYSEKNFGIYRSVLGSTIPTWFLLRPAADSFRHHTADFDFRVDTNREGVRDVEHSIEPTPGLPRIVALGDSYTEGVGVEFERSWPQLVANRLRATGRPVELLQAGVSGSDPFFEYKLLEQRLVRYSPRLVLFLLNATDICDTLWWGGLERFHADGSSHARPSPWFEPLYRWSHLARLAVRIWYDWRMVPYCEAQKRNLEAEKKIVGLLRRTQAMGQERGFEIWVGVHPTPDDIVSGTRPFSEGFFRALEEDGVAHADLTPGMDEALAGLALTDYSWPTDRHYNARGYAAMAEVVTRELEASGEIGRLFGETTPAAP